MATPTETKVQKVEHNYQDRSHLLEDAGDSGSTRPPNASDRHFPVKLHYMLAELEQDGLDHIVSWQPHGRCFVVHKQEDFVKTILPTWFRQSKFASFQRQLNLYGFKRLTTGRDKNGYYHELFLRGKRFLAHRIPRSKLKGQGARKPTSPETEPNFYLYSYLPVETSLKAKASIPNHRNQSNQRLPNTLMQGNVSLEHLLIRPPMLALPHLPMSARTLQHCGEPLYESILNSLAERRTSSLMLRAAGRSLPGDLSGVAMPNFSINGNPGLLAASGLLGSPSMNSSLSSAMSSNLALRIALSQSSTLGGANEEHRGPPKGSKWPRN